MGCTSTAIRTPRVMVVIKRSREGGKSENGRLFVTSGQEGADSRFRGLNLKSRAYLQVLGLLRASNSGKHSAGS